MSLETSEQTKRTKGKEILEAAFAHFSPEERARFKGVVMRDNAVLTKLRVSVKMREHATSGESGSSQEE